MLGALGDAHRERWARQGLRAMAPGQATAALDALLTKGPPNVVVVDADWPQFLAAGNGADGAWLEELASRGQPAGRVASNDDLLARIAASPVTRRRAMLIDTIEEHARPVLGADGTKRLDPRRPLREIGLDSLMALELRNALGARIGHTLPATLLFNYPTIDSLAEYVLRTYVPSETAAAPRSGAEDAEVPEPSDLDRLSAEEAEALLLAELDATEESWTK
jgi:acyl carrier protein